MANKLGLSNEERKLLNRTWLRSLTSKVGSTQAVSTGNGFARIMKPAIDLYYKDQPEEAHNTYIRHMEYINTNAVFFNLIMGICMAMEKKRAETRGEISAQAISSVKASLMGPCAGIGDSIFFNCIRVIVAGICIGLAANGSAMAPILFLVIYNGIEFACRYLCLVYGYHFGESIIDVAFSKGLIPLLTDAAGALGAIMVGCLVAGNVKVPLALTINVNGATVVMLDLLNSILPGVLPLLLWWFVFKLLQKGVSPVKIILGILVISVVLGVIGIF